MKKLLLAAAGACLLWGSPAEAAYQQHQLDNGAEHYEYTVFELPETHRLEAKANKIIQAAIEDQAQLRENKPERYKSVSVYSNVVRDDIELLCFTVNKGIYTGGVHGSYTVEGYTFDKRTGKRLSVRNYFPQLDLQTLFDGIYGGELKVYSADRATVLQPDWLFRLQRQDLKPDWDNIVVDSSGRVFLLFQVYALAPYASGNTYVELSEEAIARVQACKG